MHLTTPRAEESTGGSSCTPTPVSARSDGRMERIGMQQLADELQHRARAARRAFEAAREDEQRLQAEMQGLDREVEAVSAYIDRAAAASAADADAAEERIGAVQRELQEAEARLQQAHAVTREAATRELYLQQAHADLYASSETALTALQQPDPAVEAAQGAERQGRERLLAAQRRLSEALQLKAALMAHLHETQAAAATCPRYAAQRHALRVSEAQQKAVEAAKLVSMAELEVQELLASIEPLSRTAREAEEAAKQAHEAALQAAGQLAASADQAVAAAREAADAAEAEEWARQAVGALQARLAALQLGQESESSARGGDAHEKEREDQEAVLLEPLRLSHQVEAAEVLYRATLLRLQPTRLKLEQSTLQLRGRLEAYPSVLVQQLRALVELHGMEASQARRRGRGAGRGRELPCLQP
ncbi:hypothetical protein GPECTOR_75g759 [Gonium pectorale]|uniref:Uncharacterized protein n=1 Tax=Gonium pectorale TaxID=33097 RepID=A0A150G3G1_GONPE|nr:hypothetical protein GPECTOR_75g759 [Gonium pectorale]|eukprot:KXZ44035.1 hypothetical protein GPECTOR_75g759 [Gonium pectorale]